MESNPFHDEYGIYSVMPVQCWGLEFNNFYVIAFRQRSPTLYLYIYYFLNYSDEKYSHSESETIVTDLLFSCKQTRLFCGCAQLYMNCMFVFPVAVFSRFSSLYSNRDGTTDR